MTVTAILFVPADRPERFAKAIASGADAIVIDLEDAVAEERRVQARTDVRAALAGGLDALVRINSPSTQDGRADIAVLRDAPPRGIMIAKTANAHEVAMVREAFPSSELIALVESISGMEQLAPIAAAPGIAAIAFGAYDLCAQLGARPTAEVLAPWRSRMVFAARVAGCRAIDTPYLKLDDSSGLDVDAQRAVDFGFDGKLAVHPRQIAIIQAAFQPRPHEIERARRIVESAHIGGVNVTDGTMVDRPVLLAAKRVLERMKNP